MAEVQLRGVTKRWGAFTAVDNQSLTVADREFLALLGPSGCGKTTALRMIAGLEEPTCGDILIGGEQVTHEPPKNRDVAMVFQNYGLYPHMSVAENISYPLRLRKTPNAEMKTLVRQAAEKTRIGELLHRKPRELSGGQRQRVALARAIVRKPRAFLMDEPLSNLDAQLRASMRAELQHLSRELRVTTVYVTHDQIEAMTLADRIAVMRAGRICQLAPPREIYDNPADLFVAGFIGSPPMNLMRGELRDGDFVCENGKVPQVSPNTTRAEVVFGVRPEDAAITAAGEGHFHGKVYAFEQTGEGALATIETGGARVVAKGGRDLQLNISDNTTVRADTARACLFDAKTGLRI